jgi:hypothetical protein
MGARRRARWPTPCYFSAMITALSVVALVAGVVSIILAGFAMRQARHYDFDAKNEQTQVRAALEGIKA